MNNLNTTLDSYEEGLTYLDYTARVFNLIIQILYFIVIIFIKDFQSLPLIPMHHTHLIGLINAVHYALWIISNKPNLQNEYLNKVFCSFSETLWAITKYSRAYSILTVAIYRYIGVTKLTLYKKIIKLKYIIWSIVIIWLISTSIFLIAKFSAHTTHGTIYCYDGYSDNTKDNLFYYCLTSAFGYALPLILVAVFYALIQIKLVKLAKHLNNTEFLSSKAKISVLDVDDSTRNNSNHKMHKKNHVKEKKLAHQFIIINMLEFGSMIAFMMLSLNNIYPILNLNFYFLRQLLRIINLVFQSAIPIVSLLYHPHQNLNINFKFKSIKKIFFCNKFFNLCIFL